MKKELTPQIAALYLGCEVQVNDGRTGRLFGVSIDRCEIQFGDNWPMQPEVYPAILVSPLLRPLSDMTEEEAREIYRMDFGSEFEVKDWMEENPALEWIRGDNEVYREEIDIFIGSPEIWAYLLSRGFDLFGLIEAGLAKDKTKI